MREDAHVEQIILCDWYLLHRRLPAGPGRDSILPEMASNLRHLTCGIVANGETRHYCIKELKGCDEPTALQVCSWNVYTDDDHVDGVEDFNPALLVKSECDESWLTGSFPSVPQSECGSPESAGGDGGGDGGGDVGGGVSTADPEPTGGGSMGDSTGDPTGGPVKEKYLCALNVPTKCADLLPDNVLAGYGGNYADPYTNPNVPDDTEKDACWGLIAANAPPGDILSPCVEAFDLNGARAQCDVLCGEYQDDIDAKVKAICGENDPNCKVVTEIDCAMDGQVGVPPAADSFDAPAKADETPGWACDGPVMMAAWQGASDFKLFEGSATLVTPYGLTVGMSSLAGFVGYTLPNCTSNDTTCQIDFDALQLLTHYAEGGYTDASGSGGFYTLDQMGFQSLNAFSGTWNKARGTISFPAVAIQAQIWGGDATLNGDPIPEQFGVIVVEVDQIVGSLRSPQGPLSLNLSYNSPEGNVAMSLQSE